MNHPKFLVAGAGHSGLTMAAYLAIKGLTVTLFNRGEQRLHPLSSNNKVALSGEIRATTPLSNVTTNIAEAMEDVDIILVALPGNAHSWFATTIAPYVQKQHTVVLMPGRTGGALEFRRQLEQQGAPLPLLGETQTTPFTSRATGTNVHVAAIKRSVDVAALPASDNEKLAAVLNEYLPQIRTTSSTLYTGLSNVGMILHPMPMICNAGWIESTKGDFRHYYDGISPSVARVLEALDQERLNVGVAYGQATPSILEWMRSTYGIESGDLFNAIQQNASYQIVTAPENLEHRYLVEDVTTGLVPMEALANLANVRVTLISLVIDLATQLTGIAFRETGRNAAKMGIAGLSIDEIKKLADQAL